MNIHTDLPVTRVEDLSVGIFILRAYLGVRKITLRGTGLIKDCIFFIKERFVKTFILKGKNGYLPFNAGMSKQEFNNELDKLGIDQRQVTEFIHRHTDPDHIDALHLFNNAKVYMHEDEKQMINGKACKFLLAGFNTPDVFNKMNYKIFNN